MGLIGRGPVWVPGTVFDCSTEGKGSGGHCVIMEEYTVGGLGIR